MAKLIAFDEEARRGSSDLVPTKVHKVLPQNRLIPRHGMESALEKAQVSPEMEEALDI